MFIFIRHVLLSVLLITWGLTLLVGGAAAADGIAEELSPKITPAITLEITPAEQALLDYINEARQNPLAMAEAVGLSRTDVLKNFPGMQDILENGISPLTRQEQLLQTAGSHTQDMLDNNYYAYDSITGRTPQERLRAAGYAPAEWGEALGFLAFNNYISPEKAAFQIFKNMYRDELDPRRTEPQNILNPDFTEMGVGCKGGIFHFENFKMNAYLATCDFGHPMEKSELQVRQLINQARNDLAVVAKGYGVDIEKVMNGDTALGENFFKPSPPLTGNTYLYGAADAHARDMLDKEYFGKVSPDGHTPEARIVENGYGLVKWAGESIGRISSQEAEKTESDIASGLFRQFFFSVLEEAVADGPIEQTLFSATAREVGLRIIAGVSPTLSGICGDNVWLAVADYGAREADPCANGRPILGVVYQDADQDGLYDPGEGVAGSRLTLQNLGQTENNAETLTTNPAGGFNSPSLAPGWYGIRLSVNGIETERFVNIDAQAVWLAIAVQADGTEAMQPEEVSF